MAKLPSYVLITPARNEAQFIELTLRSVVAQTVLPLKWVIVINNSTDDTEAIVRKYATDYSWIELVCMTGFSERSFAGKVLAFNAGYERVANLDFDIVASLDGDISFDRDHFSFLLGKLAADPTLGLVGTPFRETSQETYDYRFVSIEHVSGCCQVFRRQCFEAIGGYKPLKGGGIDLHAVITARMKGWKTRTFTDKFCLHHRQVGTAGRGAIAARFQYGVKDYMFGNHPLWEICRAGYQMRHKPYIISGFALMAGYLWAVSRGLEKSISPEAVCFQRRQQMHRLSRFVHGNRSRGGENKPSSKCESATASVDCK
ncbi:MAG TPA: glycosyltransferase family A protein [Terriglobales bacterium]|nr:glycosyltransferase family A protein [Terriglobales bacterium]